MTVDEALREASSQATRRDNGEVLAPTEHALIRLSEFILNARAESELVHRKETPMVLIPYWFMRGN